MKTGPQGMKKDRVSGLFLFGFLLQLLHRAFVPQDGSALGQGGTHGQDALVAGPPEPQPKVFQPNHKRTVYQLSLIHI